VVVVSDAATAVVIAARLPAGVEPVGAEYAAPARETGVPIRAPVVVSTTMARVAGVTGEVAR
jgi:hypothetical protein